MSKKESTEEKSLSKTEYESLSKFRYSIRQFLKFSESAAEAVGLTSNQHQALLAIKGFPEPQGMTNGELAERLQIKHHSAVGLVNRLEAQNLVCRERSASDRRAVYLMLTRSGEKLLEDLTAAHREELKRLAPQLISILQSLEQSK